MHTNDTLPGNATVVADTAPYAGAGAPVQTIGSQIGGDALQLPLARHCAYDAPLRMYPASHAKLTRFGYGMLVAVTLPWRGAVAPVQTTGSHVGAGALKLPSARHCAYDAPLRTYPLSHA